MASYIVSDTWYVERKEDINDEAKRIIKTAAKLVKNNIKESIISNTNSRCTIGVHTQQLKMQKR